MSRTISASILALRLGENLHDEASGHHWKMIFLILILSNAINCLENHNHNQNQTVPWTYISIQGHADNILSNDNDGSVIVVVNSNIYKYDTNLKLLSSNVNTTHPYNLTSSESNTQVKALSLIRVGPSQFVLACWSTKYTILKCLLYKYTDLIKVAPLQWSIESRGYRSDQFDRLQICATQADTTNILFIVSRLTPVETNAQQQVPYLPAVSQFKISKSKEELLLYLDLVSVLPYKTQENDQNILYDHVYAFVYNNHTHFILNDIRKSPNSNAVRLARICNNDTAFSSYTEISLYCKRKTNQFAKFAYLDTSVGDPTLHVIYDDDTKHQFKKAKGSELCSYSVTLIEDLFDRAITECNSGSPVATLLTKLNSETSHPISCQRNPSAPSDWCFSKINPFIDGHRIEVNEESSMMLNGLTDINFFHATTQGSENKVVYLIGTKSGHLTKISSDEDLYYTIDLLNSRMKGYKLGDKLPNLSSNNTDSDQEATMYAVSNRNLIAVSPGRINLLDIDKCHYYTTCQMCLNSRDPLDCVWCGDSCSIKAECDESKQSTSSCPPIIKDFTPRVGPTTGSTRLQVFGENLGSSRGTLQVKVGDNDCDIDRDASSNELVVCSTKPVASAIESAIRIIVDDESGYIFSKGETVSKLPFKYVNTTVFGLYPYAGPSSGGNKISIFGENLDCGWNRTVRLGEIDCPILNVSQRLVTCSAKSSGLNSELVQEKALIFMVDSHKQPLKPMSLYEGRNLSVYYQYRKDITSVEDDEAVTVDGLVDMNGLPPLILIAAAITLILGVVIFLFRSDWIPKIKLKTPPTFDSNGSGLVDAKVSFRNPQSDKFSGSQRINTAGESVHGLIKLNGSVMSSDYFGKPEQLDQDRPLMSQFVDDDMLSILAQEKILIDRNRLTLGHVLGSGQFGRVYKGFLKVGSTGEHTEVAVKTLHNRATWDEVDNRAFLEEGLMMKDFEHENVLALIGVTFDANGLPMVITPFMLYGDLRSYISDEASSPTVKELIDFGTQVARGMAYLSNLKFVHRDLAARNCMLDENLKVKVADFGLSRDIYERDYYSSDNKKTKLPVKWMAIESLEKCIYNTKTDVWSYGVLLWELMTRGVVPYPDVDNFDLFSYLKEGRRMLRPRYCPMILYKIMLSCWNEDPANRPTFNDLVQSVSDVINQLKIAKDGQQKVSRDITYCDGLK